MTDESTLDCIPYIEGDVAQNSLFGVRYEERQAAPAAVGQ